MSGYDITNTVLGAAGLIGTMQLVYAYVTRRFPGARQQELDRILRDTHRLFDTVLEEGLPFDQQFITDINNALTELQRRANNTRSQSHAILTFADNFRELFNGLSGTISELTTAAANTRATISTASEQRRQDLERQGVHHRVPLYQSTPRAPYTGVPITVATGSTSGLGQSQRSIFERSTTSARQIRPDAFVPEGQAGIVGSSNTSASATGGRTQQINVGHEQLQLEVMNEEANRLATPMAPGRATHSSTSRAPVAGSSSIRPARQTSDIHAMNTQLEGLTQNLNILEVELNRGKTRRRDGHPGPSK